MYLVSVDPTDRSQVTKFCNEPGKHFISDVILTYVVIIVIVVITITVSI